MLLAGVVAIGVVILAADHIDAPKAKDSVIDITDYHAFAGNDENNLVFAASLTGFLTPGTTGAAKFDENTLIEFNIDNNGDNIEDLVIQAIPKDGKMYFFGPVKPGTTGLDSRVESNALYKSSVDITPYKSEVIKETTQGITYFAGPRDDPFFFDFARYTMIIEGKETGFAPEGNDTFAGTNVMSIVVEVPKALLGGRGTLNTWVESKSKK